MGNLSLYDCDRCDKEAQAETFGRRPRDWGAATLPMRDGSSRLVDLCPSCAKELHEWFEKGKA